MKPAPTMPSDPPAIGGRPNGAAQLRPNLAANAGLAARLRDYADLLDGQEAPRAATGASSAAVPGVTG